MKNTPFILSICTAVLLPVVVHAGPILRSGETISIDATQALEGDFYGMAQKVSISGAAAHDVYVGGLNVTINAPVAEDLSVVGGTVQIHGPVGDDVRILGGEITIGDRVGGDVVVYGGTLHILSTAHIEGELIFYGESLLVEGDVNGSVHGFSKKARIDAVVEGDITYTVTETLTLGENAHILGTITHEGRNTLSRAQGAVVEGDIYHNQVSAAQQSTRPIEPLLFLLGILVFAALTLYFLGRQYIVRNATTPVREWGKHGLLGLLILIAVPFVSFILMVSVIGVFVGLLLLFAYLAALILSVVFVAIAFGYYVQKFISKNMTIGLQTLFIGPLTFVVVLFIPVLGPLFVFAATMIMLGGLGRQAFRGIRT